METLNELFTEDQANTVSNKILTSIKDKVIDVINDDFYKQAEGYLFEIYLNSRNKIETSLINEISDNYVNNPSDYKYKEIRAKIWTEHKNEILPSLTADVIIQNMECVLLNNTGSTYHFNWQWKDGIVKLILCNWDYFRNDERIEQQFGREIDRLKSQINSLQNQLNEIQIITEKHEE